METMKRTETKLLVVNSKDRNNGTINNFRITLNNNHLDNIKRVILISSTFMNSEYNVNQKNNVLSYQLNGGGFVDYTLPEGNYGSNDLTTALTAGLAGITVSLSNDNKDVFEFTTDGATTLDINFANSSMSELIGLTSDKALAITTTAQMDTIPDLSGLSIVHVASKALSHSNSLLSDNKHNDVISSIPVIADFGLPNVYSNDNHLGDHMIYKSTNNLNSIDIKLLDNNFEECLLQKDIQLIFKISF